ncbi:MAG: hypothetical protein WC527_04640 [Candidatus Margulisiibacteriota bacterium]
MSEVQGVNGGSSSSSVSVPPAVTTTQANINIAIKNFNDAVAARGGGSKGYVQVTQSNTPGFVAVKSPLVGKTEVLKKSDEAAGFIEAMKGYVEDPKKMPDTTIQSVAPKDVDPTVTTTTEAKKAAKTATPAKSAAMPVQNDDLQKPATTAPAAAAATTASGPRTSATKQGPAELSDSEIDGTLLPALVKDINSRTSDRDIKDWKISREGATFKATRASDGKVVTETAKALTKADITEAVADTVGSLRRGMEVADKMKRDMEAAGNRTETQIGATPVQQENVEDLYKQAINAIKDSTELLLGSAPKDKLRAVAAAIKDGRLTKPQAKALVTKGYISPEDIEKAQSRWVTYLTSEEKSTLRKSTE